MVAHVDQPIRSQRFIKAYLLLWGLLAIGALAYLAALAFQPQHNSGPRPQTSEPEQSIRAMTKALANVDKLQRNLGEVQKDLSQLKDTVGERETQEKAVHTRLSALEERVATIDASQQAAAGPASAKQKAADKAQRKTPEQKVQARVIPVGPEAAPGPAPAHRAETPPLETGSIVTSQPVITSQPVVTTQTVAAAQPVVTSHPPATPQPAITFGEPVVTASAPQGGFAVQIAAGPSLSAVKLSWGILLERHGAALTQLQPRVIPPRADGGPYRLLAGPLPTKQDAERVCADMNVGRSGCFATAFVGEPL